MRLAAIDIGTLTCRLLVADVNLPDEFKELDADRRILRLGEGVDQHKRLSVEAMERVAEVVTASDKTLGIYAGTPEFAADWYEKGARYFTSGVEGFLKQGMQAYLSAVRG